MSQTINITKNITGKISGGTMVLYHNDHPIGKIDLQSKEMSLEEGYEAQGADIYSLQSTVEQEQYAEDCDMGWC
ncbi:YusG family protein [Mechercharimyces sp. CAU 1602]|uniref:YusG family protein n=1 Tax=Mechercharimyces sp. CAU 1602 TaxID=2973933 RepID=UPI002161A862|nr:YusG family protein [Mechercharimyces sp. CAU 1602]MCS1351963.1 YusG family protein [Mechercharimyces sp. CAU 1602]